jgi:hypothetical protein
MTIQRTTEGACLISDCITPYEESLLYSRLNAAPKTMAKASPKQLKKKRKRLVMTEGEKQKRFLQRTAWMFPQFHPKRKHHLPQTI